MRKGRVGDNVAVRMLLQIITVILVLLANSTAERGDRHSISGEFGSAAGTSFSYSGPHRWGPITAFRVWEYPYYYIYGYVLVKHSTYIYQLIISTSHRRIFFFGQPYGTCFNALPLDHTDELSFLSGHHNGASITGLMMH
ncbi:zymogen granule membrane protein 16 [Emydura macquarii macquarii]|uniref:zymogen granule membrane protein 16 n=1 Tax=Emydura macquarii macquarii TaxID=1129001 RepID=UPI00352BC4D2